MQNAKGFYASSYQGSIDWDRAGREFDYVHIRVSSAKHADSAFIWNWNEAGRVGLLRSAWHYLMPNVSGQAGFFCDTLGGRVAELGYYVDLEDSDLTLDKAESFLTAADRLLETTVGVYTSAGWLNPRGNPAWGNRRLWVANWTDRSEPLLPKAWNAWEFWQHTGGIAVPGFPKPICLDRSAYTSEQLRAKYGKPVVEPPIVTPPVIPPNEPPIVPPTEGIMEIRDIEGNLRDWDWLRAKYGNVTIAPAALPAYCVSELRERDGPAILLITVQDQGGKPVEGQQVCYDWPGDKACGPTKEGGVVGFGLGHGSYYYLDRGETGPHSVWIPDKASERVRGLGFLPGTEHMRLDPTFQWKEKSGTEPPPAVPPVEPPPPPIEPPADVFAQIIAKLDHIIAMVEAKLG